MSGAGQLTEKVTLESRQTTNPDAPDDYGNTVSTWASQGEAAAQYIHLRGGETVMSGRLAGKHTQVVRLRASALTRSVTADWRVTDARSGTVFNIRDVTHTPDRAWVDLLVESGVA